MSTYPVYITILEEKTIMQKVVSNMETPLAIEELNAGGCRFEKVIVIGGSTTLTIKEMKMFLIGRLITITRASILYFFYIANGIKCNYKFME